MIDSALTLAELADAQRLQRVQSCDELIRALYGAGKGTQNGK